MVGWLPVPGFWAVDDLEVALANVPRQDADCEGLIDVNLYGSSARLVITIAH
jgi:hypothetical protein